jgi:hypothetical protein
MTTSTILNIVFSLSILLVVVLITGTPSTVWAQPEVDNYFNTGGLGGWYPPPMGGPLVQYVTDPDTGKEWLVEIGYWGTARISDSDLNDVEADLDRATKNMDDP